MDKMVSLTVLVVILGMLVTLVILPGCAGTHLAAMTEDEALAPIAQQVMVAQLIEESKNPKATATKVYTIASQPDLSANAEQLKSQIYAQFDYNSLDVSSQILVQALIDALVKDLTDATQMATEQETLEGWREAAKLASARFL